MNQISITKLTFTYQSEQKNITAQQFRGAFIDYIRTNFSKKLQEELPMHLAFNKDKNGNQLNRYSLMQYKIYSNKLEIIAIADSRKISDQWLSMVLKNNDFTINGKPIALADPKNDTHTWFPQLEKTKLYKIQSWKPFDTKTIGDESKFDKIIWGNIHRMLSDLEVKFSEKVKIDILETKKTAKSTKAFGVNWINYDIIISTNINLPQHIGIGHIVSLGSGKITKVKLM